jgi:intein/homing endonuclease
MATVTEPETSSLKLIQLRAQNFMRLEALTIDADGHHVVISGPNGCGKCLPEGTPVALWNGTRKRIENIRETDLLVGMDRSTHRWKPEHPLGMMTSGVKEVFEVVTKRGYRITATANHRLLSPDGWIELNAFKPGDFLAIPMWLPSGNAEERVSDSEAMLLGLMLGDGCFRRGVSFTAADPGVQRLFRRCVSELWPQAMIRERAIPGVTVGSIGQFEVSRGKRGKQVGEHTAWARELGLLGKTAYSKFVPEKMFGAGARAIALFLAGLFSTDGSVEEDGEAEYGTRSFRLAESIRGLLLRLGIPASLRSNRKRPNASADFLPFYVVRVVTQTGRQRFFEKIIPEMSPSRVKTAKRERLNFSQAFSLPPRCVELLRQAGAPGIDSWVRGHNRIGRDRFLKALACTSPESQLALHRYGSEDVGWDSIKSIRSVGTVQTFDLSMPSEAFVANDFLVHNSSSVDAIWAALGGMSKSQLPEPVHHGTQRAEVHLDLGEYLVERTWDDRGTRVTITAADGSKIRRPQELLDGLLGQYSLDPVAFLERRPQDQVDDVLAICGVSCPTEAVRDATGEDHRPLDGESASSYLERLSADETGVYYLRRREANRQCTQKRDALAEHRQIVERLGGPVKPGEEPPSTAALVARLQQLNEQDSRRRAAFHEVAEAKNGLAQTQTKLNGLKMDQVRLSDSIGKTNAEILRLQQQIRRLEGEKVEQKQSLVNVEGQLSDGEKILVQWQDFIRDAESAAREIPDVALETKSVNDQIARVEQTAQSRSRRLHATEQLDRLAKEVEHAQAAHKDLDDTLTRLRDLRVHLLDGVDLGVPGLEVGMGELRLNGVSFRQASQAQRIRIAAAVAMRQKPRLRLLKIDEGERLDSESRKLLFDLAERAGFQIVMTSVSDQSSLKVEIVDGANGRTVG